MSKLIRQLRNILGITPPDVDENDIQRPGKGLARMQSYRRWNCGASSSAMMTRRLRLVQNWGIASSRW